MPRLAVCWIWASPFVMSDSVESLMQLERPEGWDVQFFRGIGWSPSARHISACQKAVDWNADYILIVGADQVYELDLLKRLTARVEEGYETMCALVPTRGYVGHQNMKPFQPIAWRFKTRSGGLADVMSSEYRGMELDRDLLEQVDPADGDVQRINFIGSGVMMFHRDHLLALERPWFFETIDYKTQRRTACMDTKFAWRLQVEGGARLWLDTTIKVKHLHLFKIDETFQDRFDDWEKPGVGDPVICMYPNSTTPEPVAT